jgi:hypothetical protein
MPFLTKNKTTTTMSLPTDSAENIAAPRVSQWFKNGDFELKFLKEVGGEFSFLGCCDDVHFPAVMKPKEFLFSIEQNILKPI